MEDTAAFEILPPYLQGSNFQSVMLIQVQYFHQRHFGNSIWIFIVLTTPVATHPLNIAIESRHERG